MKTLETDFSEIVYQQMLKVGEIDINHTATLKQALFGRKEFKRLEEYNREGIVHCIIEVMALYSNATLGSIFDKDGAYQQYQVLKEDGMDAITKQLFFKVLELKIEDVEEAKKYFLEIEYFAKTLLNDASGYCINLLHHPLYKDFISWIQTTKESEKILFGFTEQDVSADLNIANDTQRLLLFRELGILDYLRKEYPETYKGVKMAKLLKALTATTMQDISYKSEVYKALNADLTDNFSSETIASIHREIRQILPDFTPKGKIKK